MESGDPQSRGLSVAAQPEQAELITSREYNDNWRGSCDIREGKRELDGRMDGLTGLRAGRQVRAGNDEKATRQQALTMRHISMVARVTCQR